MDKLDEIVVVNGVEYTQRELDVLREFSGRETIGPSSNNTLKAFLNIKDAGHKDINTYLATGVIPSSISAVNDLQTFLSKVETLYNIACKYGASHDFPRNPLHREEEFYQDIVGHYDYRHDSPVQREYVSEAFKSFSKSRSESTAFSKGEFGSHQLVIHDSDNLEARKIPFIDVNDLLGTDHVFSDETEVLLPPYQKFLVDSSASIISRNPKKWDDPINDFGIKVTGDMRNPYTVSRQKSDNKELSTYSSKNFDVSDAELELIVELNKKKNTNNSELTPEENATFQKLTDKLKAYTMTRCRSLYKMQIEHPLVVGKYITKETARYHKELLDASSSVRDRKEKIYTKEDDAKHDDLLGLYGLLMNSSPADHKTLKNYELLDSTQNLSPEILKDVLDSGHSSGNREMVRALAKQGLILDEVLAFNGKITPKGSENLSFISVTCNVEKEKGKSKPILLSELESTRKLLGIDLFQDIHTVTAELAQKGLTLLTDDDEKSLSSARAIDSLSQIGKTKRSSEIADDYSKFVEYIDRDGLVQVQTERDDN